MKTDYITSGSTLPPSLDFPRFLLGVNVRFTAKEVYTIMLNMTLNSENVQTDKHGRRYLAFFNKTIAGKSYIYPLIPFRWSELKKRFFRGRLPHREKVS